MPMRSITVLYCGRLVASRENDNVCQDLHDWEWFCKGSHLSLFFVVMRGDYDALQTWPFQKKITMMLLDQGYGDHNED